MSNFDSGDSTLSVTGSIVGIVALLISVSAITQALFVYFTAYRDAPAELLRITSSISNTVDENSHRLRLNHVPGGLALDMGKTSASKGRWTDMLQEYFDAHLELDEELEKIKQASERTGSLFNRNRLFWVFRRKDLEESVRRVETLRMRKMAVALNALVEDVSHIKDTLERIEARIPAGPLRLPPSKPPQEPDSVLDLPRPLNLYSSSILGESVTSFVRTSLDSQ
ncbi:hypothetical protein K505DRAFT_55334 [Melanomma pulvis-pyrius CBS 109.77]|uniref:Fungal N-terminal domain-containing protein n=1 Tax=Melanomma pulvis-pyrius CBS 109.77 TaxID=1314802 RepID=A0A6A6X821_9PLEO|nr:hypothetical protein K505DRAFT_55334 [Melanomma pulvis-pyrius CBS 109.77]